MYSQQDLDDAVAAGALPASSADALRAFVEAQRATAIPDEEQFRLITGFNDIFVSIAAAILLFAVGWIGQSTGASLGLRIEREGPSFLAPLAIAATAWGLALYFTSERRMALPSILLLLAFVGGAFAAVAFALIQAFVPNNGDPGPAVGGGIAAIAGLAGAGAALAHWRRFRVPITIAAGAASVAALVVALVVAIVGPDEAQMGTIILWTVLALGIAIFLVAMRWDESDRARLTRRSDVAFWLHLLAAPMIVHPVFTLLGLNDGNATILEAFVVLALYIGIGVTALAIDRRALLVSALAYVLYALTVLFRTFGAVELNIALTALVIGSALLLLSAFWHQARRRIVSPLPQSIRDKLPLIGPSEVSLPVG